ncbi:MAG: HPP family protein [Desulfomonilaceae bacterium]
MKYLDKMKGVSQSPPAVSRAEVLWSWVGSFLGIAAIGIINYFYMGSQENALMIASFAASAVLLFGAPKSPLAQPRNLVGGHLLAAFIGVAFCKIFITQPALAASLAVSTSIAVMHLTRTLHPPAGATALNAVIGGPKVHALGFTYPFIPVALGVAVMLAVAVLFNNAPKTRRYPEFWL